MSNELEILREFPFSSRQNWAQVLREWHFDGPQLRLDWLVHFGGPLRARLEEVISENSEFRMTIAMRPDPVAEFEIRHWLESFNRRVFGGRPSTIYISSESSSDWFQQWNISLRDVAIVVRDTDHHEKSVPLEAFLRKVLTADGKLGDEDTALAIFRRIWRAQGHRETPWMVLRHWLREPEAKPYSIFPVQREIERLISYLSPQDEVAELESLANGQVMINPTLEILTKPQDRLAPLCAIARFRGSLVERDLGLAEAALIEAIREEFRADAQTAMNTASREARVSGEEISRALQRLKLEGFVLSSAD